MFNRLIMEQLSKEQRLEVYTQLLNKLTYHKEQKDFERKGFCQLLAIIYEKDTTSEIAKILFESEDRSTDVDDYYFIIKEYLPELYAQQPKKYKPGAYWYPLPHSIENMNKRIDCLAKAIKDLQI